MKNPKRARTRFSSLDSFVATPRISGLALSPDGRRLVTGVEEPNTAGNAYVRSVWEIDTSGQKPPRRLLRSVSSEIGPSFLPDGSLLFTSVRADGSGSGTSANSRPALWRLPTLRGEPERIADWPGGISKVVVACEAGTATVAAWTLRGTTTKEEDMRRRRARQDRSVQAILHEGYPTRSWNSNLGLDELRLFACEPSDGRGGDGWKFRDLTPAPNRAMDGADFDVSRDGKRCVATWILCDPGFVRRRVIVEIDIAAASPNGVRTVASSPCHNFFTPKLAPDGRSFVCVRERRPTADQPARPTLWWQPLDGRDGRELMVGFDLQPSSPVWSPDGTTIYFVADEEGRRPVFAIGLHNRAVRRLASEAAYSNLVPSPDGRRLYALRSAVDMPIEPVVLDALSVDQCPQRLGSPAPELPLPGHLENVETITDDGTRVRGWLALPENADAREPCPLLLWIHGGPHSSWNAWHWRWNPWVMAAHGYAVLLPDPALSTGYGEDFVQRGYNAWNRAPFTDLMAITDEVCAREEIDAGSTAVMGASFGGYMANWIAGHTDRFKCVVTHAGLWAMDQYGRTSDLAIDWKQQFPAERAMKISPHHGIEQISTPMLVIHGERDYRVPLSESLRLWSDLAERHIENRQRFPHRFLQFPDEAHRIFKPQNLKIWYETVLAFLAWHIRGEEWDPPELLR